MMMRRHKPALIADHPQFKAAQECTAGIDASLKSLCDAVYAVNGQADLNSPCITQFEFKATDTDLTIRSFFGACTRFVFDNFSNKPYPPTTIMDAVQNFTNFTKRPKVPRPNHGAGNHFRQMLFSTIMVHTLIKYNPEAFMGVINIDKQTRLNKSDVTKRYLAIVAGSLFQQIARISELETIKFGMPKRAEETRQKEKTYTYTHIYEFIMQNKNGDQELIAEFNDVAYIGVQQFVSYVIYNIVMTKMLNPKGKDNKIQSFINTLTASALYYMQEQKHKGYQPQDKVANFYLLNELVAGGHYMDHCRGSYSKFFEHNSALYYLYVISLSPQASVGKVVEEMEAVVLHTLVVTMDLDDQATEKIQCIKKNMKVAEAKSVRNYRDTPQRIELLTKYENLFNRIFPEFNRTATIHMLISTTMNPRLQHMHNKVVRYELAKELNDAINAKK